MRARPPVLMASLLLALTMGGCGEPHRGPPDTGSPSGQIAGDTADGAADTAADVPDNTPPADTRETAADTSETAADTSGDSAVDTVNLPEVEDTAPPQDTTVPDVTGLPPFSYASGCQ